MALLRSGRGMTRPYAPGRFRYATGLQGHAPAALAQAYLRRQRHQALGFWPVIPDWRDGEDEPALAEADLLDQDRVAGVGQHDDITRIDVTSQDHIIHVVHTTARKDRFHRPRKRKMCGT